MTDYLRRILDSQIDLAGLTDGYFRSELKIPDGQAVDSHVSFKGHDCLQFSGQDYLSLTQDPRVIQAGIDAMQKYGVGALGSPVVTGTLDLHIELQQSIARFMNAEGAIVFTTGMLTNLGCIPAIINSPYRVVMGSSGRGKRRAIFADEKIHESLRMACDLCEVHGVKVHKYEHGNYAHLDSLMNKFGCESNLILTDSVFSMDGDIAPLKEIVQVAESQSQEGRLTAIWADEAHGVGILGENGRGVCEMLGVEDKVITMGVLSKAFGTLGGFAVGPKWLTDYLAYCSTHMFSLSLPPAETAASIAAIKIVSEEPYRRERLLASVGFLRQALVDAGFKVLGDGTQIIFVVIGDEAESTRISALLEEEGILCPEIKFPAVGMGQAGLRLTPTFNHSDADLERFLDKFFEITRK